LSSLLFCLARWLKELLVAKAASSKSAHGNKEPALRVLTANDEMLHVFKH